ncbi:MAG: hypothetical protein JXR07_10280 [Reichenbachiella sp.]
MEHKKFDIEKLPKSNLFKVPEQYFEELPTKIQEQITTPSQSSIFFDYKMQWIGSLTAAAIIIFVGIWFYPNTNIQEVDLLADISSSEIIDYLDYEDISTYEIAYVIDVETLLSEGEPNNYIDLSEEQLSDEELESIYTEYDFSTDIL